VLTFEELEDHVRTVLAIPSHVVDARDVVALQPHGRAGLAHEALDRAAARERLGEDELQRDRLPELDVRGRDDHAHAAGAEHALDTVLPAYDVSRRDGRARAD